MKTPPKTLAAKISIGLPLIVVMTGISGLGISPPALALFGVGDIVFDPINNVSTLATSLNASAQTAKQIDQYKTQLLQYENMLKNTMAPAAYVWDQATTTMNKLRSSIDTLNYYKTTLGGVDSYLSKFKDTAAYRDSPCYSISGCTDAEWAAMKDSERLGSESQKKATDALFKGLDEQQNAMQSDASQLESLQKAAQTATGQMEAISYANQLASHQANQLLQIRGLLISQQNAIATRNQALADREAKEAASAAQLRTGKFVKSSAKSW